MKRSKSSLVFQILPGFLLIVTALLWTATLIAQPPVDSAFVYIIENDYPVQSLVEKTQFLASDKGQYTIEDLLHPDSNFSFRALHNTDYQFNEKKHYWLKLDICAKETIKDWWLLLKKSPGVSNEYLGNNNYVDVYFTQNGAVTEYKKTGVFVPASQKEIPEIVTCNRIFFSLDEGQSVVLYIKIANISNEWSNPYPELRNPAMDLPLNEAWSSWSMKVLSGFSFILGLYMLFFFFFTKDISYFYFFGFLLFTFLHYQILHPQVILIDWFLPEHPQLVLIAWTVLTMGSHAFFLQLGRSFCDLKNHTPFWDKVLRGIINSMILYIILHSIWIMISKGAPLRILGIANFIIPVFFLASFIVFVRLIFIKNRLVRYYVFGAAWMFFFAFIGILWNNDLVPFFTVPNPWVTGQGGVMIILALGLAYKFQISEKAKTEVETIKEVEAVKSRFFTNISHEFRTPLSLILGPLKKLEEQIPASDLSGENGQSAEIPVALKYIRLMRRNGERLLVLINQLLDLSKLESGKMQLKVAQGDIVQFLRAIVFSFESMAERRQIHFQTEFPSEHPEAWFDKDTVEKIVVNLLSNAFKYTSEKGMVAALVSLEKDRVRIVVKDNGSGIEKAELEKIFDRFYMVEGTEDKGTGIGLSLVKELINVHKGQISVESTKGQGTSFKVSIPFGKSFYSPDEIVKQHIDEKSYKVNASLLHELPSDSQGEITENGTLTQAKPVLLVVEDNPDLRQYIAENLEAHYQILKAADGKMGLEIASEKIPDLIVSDVMMPRMDGFELCKQLKTGMKTSHIPVVLLTAKAGQQHKIEGLETGADDYLTKPFDVAELQVRVANLIRQRRVLQEKYSKDLLIKPSEIAITSADERFLNITLDHIEKNLDNEFFSVEDLADFLAMSRSQLHRKLKAITGKGPNRIIRDFRLQRAKELLEKKAGTISEIAFQVGYNSQSYFSRSFKQLFGIRPNEVATKE